MSYISPAFSVLENKHRGRQIACLWLHVRFWIRYSATFFGHPALYLFTFHQTHARSSRGFNLPSGTLQSRSLGWILWAGVNPLQVLGLARC